MSNSPVVVWFRNDLRLRDNPALSAALAQGRPVIPVYVWRPEAHGAWAPGAASRWWLHHSLASLNRELEELGSRLVIRRSAVLESLLDLTENTGARSVFWNRGYEPALVQSDAGVERALLSQGVDVQTFNAALLHEPASIANKSGRPFQVFTAFWRRCLEQPDPGEALPAPDALPRVPASVTSLALDELSLLPTFDWASGLRSSWNPGERGAEENLRRFLSSAFQRYDQQRNLPAVDGTSRLSPHLAFGEVSPRQVWHSVRAWAVRHGLNTAQWRSSQFLTELGWREFGWHLLYHFPKTPEQPLRPEFANFQWRTNPKALEAWKKGRTGIPLVDAGLRQLWDTGWMHNRVRMVAASFLVKNLLLPWQAGARWFWDTLVDADLANNTLGWQWVAGSGADAAPFFRIFNPVLQGQKFDPHGEYVRRWLPELAALPARYIHAPFKAPQAVLDKASIRLGHDYPEPVVSLFASREAALEAYARLRAPRASRVAARDE